MKIDIKRNIDLVRLRNLVRSTLIKAYHNASKRFDNNFIDLAYITDFTFPDEYSNYSDVYQCILNMYEGYKNDNNTIIKYITTKQVSLIKEINPDFRLNKTAKAIPIYKYKLDIKPKSIEEDKDKNRLFEEYDLTIYNTKVYYVFNLITESNFTSTDLSTYRDYIDEDYRVRNEMQGKYYYNFMLRRLLNVFINRSLWYCPITKTNTIRCTEYDEITHTIFVSNKEDNFIRYISSFVRAMCESIFFSTKLTCVSLFQTVMRRKIICDIVAAAILRKFYFPYNPCFFSNTNLKLYLDELKSDELIDEILFLAQDIFNIVYIRLIEIHNDAYDILRRDGNANIPTNQFQPLTPISSIIRQIPEE